MEIVCLQISGFFALCNVTHILVFVDWKTRGSKTNDSWLPFLCGKESWKKIMCFSMFLSDTLIRQNPCNYVYYKFVPLFHVVVHFDLVHLYTVMHHFSTFIVDKNPKEPSLAYRLEDKNPKDSRFQALIEATPMRISKRIPTDPWNIHQAARNTNMEGFSS